MKALKANLIFFYNFINNDHQKQNLKNNLKH